MQEAQPKPPKSGPRSPAAKIAFIAGLLGFIVVIACGLFPVIVTMIQAK
jgi:hypothetical protein